MNDPVYNFIPRPNFERLDTKFAMQCLFEVNHSLAKSWFEKKKLEFQFRSKELNRLSNYDLLVSTVLSQICQYLDSWEFYDYFGLNLNFKLIAYLQMCHVWLICDRCQEINSEASLYLKNKIIELSYSHFVSCNTKFELLASEQGEVINPKKSLNTLFDSLSWHFRVLNRDSLYRDAKETVSKNVFLDEPASEETLMKVADYLIHHFCYFREISEDKLLTNDFSFTVFKSSFPLKEAFEERQLKSRNNEDLLGVFKENVKFFIEKYDGLSENDLRAHFANCSVEELKKHWALKFLRKVKMYEKENADDDISFGITKAELDKQNGSKEMTTAFNETNRKLGITSLNENWERRRKYLGSN